MQFDEDLKDAKLGVPFISFFLVVTVYGVYECEHNHEQNVYLRRHE